jgi:hypothetical protein
LVYALPTGGYLQRLRVGRIKKTCPSEGVGDFMTLSEEAGREYSLKLQRVVGMNPSKLGVV